MIPNPIVEVRLNNPRVVDGKYQVDFEFKCAEDPGRKLAAMNLRLFYSSSDFEHDQSTMRFVDMFYNWGLAPYQVLKGYKGNQASTVLFNTDGPAVYINTAIQGPFSMEQAENVPVLDEWVKYFALELTPKRAIGSGDFAPPIILDKESIESRGGFLPNDGLTMALCIPNGLSSQASTYVPCREVPTQFNWDYNGNLTYPFGTPNPTVFV